LRLANSPNKSGARIGKVLRIDDIASTPPDLSYRGQSTTFSRESIPPSGGLFVFTILRKLGAPLLGIPGERQALELRPQHNQMR
jgi:hypothetical protein